MTIDEAIKELTESYNFWMEFACDDVLEEGEHKVNHCEKNANYCYQLIQWLEELKAKRNIGECAYKQGYNKGIDDLENKILSNCASMLKDGDRVIVIRMDIFKFILGQLKDGAKNE